MDQWPEMQVGMHTVVAARFILRHEREHIVGLARKGLIEEGEMVSSQPGSGPCQRTNDLLTRYHRLSLRTPGRRCS